jgi:hypothetical protein
VGISLSCWFSGPRDTKGKEDCGSEVFIAEDINVVGDRESGDNTSDLDTLGGHIFHTVLQCHSITISRVSTSRLKEFCCK